MGLVCLEMVENCSESDLRSVTDAPFTLAANCQIFETKKVVL